MSTEELKPADGTTPEPEVNHVEQAAMERGWKPKDEYNGDPEKWRSAEVFLALDEPLKRIEHQSKEMKQLRAALEAFKEHHTKVEASAFDRALKQLQTERKQAMIDGDTEKVFELEAEADQVKEQKRVLQAEAARPVVQEPQLNPEFVEWRNKNSWYQSNTAMTAVADAYGRELNAAGHSPAQVLRMVAERVREEFPTKFKTPASGRPSPVEGSTRGGSSSKAELAMSEEETAIMRRILKVGGITEAQYKAELKRVKEL